VKNRTGKTNFLPGIFWGADLFRSFEFPFPPYFLSRDLPYLSFQRWRPLREETHQAFQVLRSGGQ
jgi:hypothetical protein